MSTPTTDQGLTLPVDGDLAAIDTILANYNTGVESRLVKRYDSSVDRGVRNPTPAKGEVSYLADSDTHERFDGVVWRNMRGGTDHFYLPGETGALNISFTNQSSFSVAVTFAATFSLIPRIMTNITSGAAATGGWHSRGINASTTGFTFFVESATNTLGTWSSIPVEWVAIARS